MDSPLAEFSLLAISPDGEYDITEDMIPGAERLSTPEEAKHMALILVALGSHTIRIEGAFGMIVGHAFAPKRPVLMGQAQYN